MMRRVVSAAAIAMLAGCSAMEAQRPIANAITPPADWKAFPIPMKVAANPILGMWMHSKGKDDPNSQMIMLLRIPSDDKKSMTDTIVSSSGAKGSTVVSRKDVTLCDGAKGVAAELKGTQTSGTSTRQTDVNVVAGQGKGETLVAVYTRTLGQPADPAAMAAVSNLCPILKT
jgi:hypothetical protein